ncbi:hypothetical protein [Streptomyces sasae]|nr:hypothetical protein [Streptomyces sasae]
MHGSNVTCVIDIPDELIVRHVRSGGAAGMPFGRPARRLLDLR